MCRLLAIQSKDAVPLSRVLIGGDNSFAVQSLEHPDGWGMAYYVQGSPHVVKSVLPAISDAQFERISLSVGSPTLLAHIRRATTGRIAARNCHPFQFGPWVFAHNGFIRNYVAVKDELQAKIKDRLRPFIIGETDSETLFFLFLSYLEEAGELCASQPSERAMGWAITRAIEDVISLGDVGPEVVPHPGEASRLSVLVSNGSSMMGVRWGKPLAFQATKTQRGHELLTISSEVIGSRSPADAGAWVDLEDKQYLFVDPSLTLRHAAL